MFVKGPQKRTAADADGIVEDKIVSFIFFILNVALTLPLLSTGQKISSNVNACIDFRPFLSKTAVVRYGNQLIANWYPIIWQM